MRKSLLLIPALVFLTAVSFSQPITYDWSRYMAGRPGNATNATMAKDASGNLYVMGEFTGTRSFDSYFLTSLGYSDIFVAKYSPAGACLWAISGGAGFSSATAGRIIVNGNDLYITGSFTNVIQFGTIGISSTGGRDVFIASLNSADGAPNWVNLAGGLYDDVGIGISPAIGGGFYLCGTFTGTATFGSFNISSTSSIDNDAFYSKYDATGTCTWANRIGGTDYDQANFINQDVAGNIYITGSFEGVVTFGSQTLISGGYSDYFLTKINTSGTIVWTAQGASENNDIGYSISFDPAGNIYSTGMIADTATFGTQTVNNWGTVNVFVAKHNAVGDCLWLKTAGSITADVGYDIVTDAGGSSYVTGYITGNANFDGTIMNTSGNSDGFVAKYDNNGTLRWVSKLGVANTEAAKSVVLDANGYCYVAGEFDGTMGIGTLPPLTADPNSFCVFLLHMGGGTVGLEESADKSTSVYPNPANEQISLQITGVTDALFSLELVDATGRVAHSRMLNQQDISKKIDINTRNIPSGIYFLNVSSSAGNVSKRVSIIHN